MTPPPAGVHFVGEMINDDVLDAVLPVPELEVLKDETVAELQTEGFVLTNFNSGGIFYTLLMVAIRIKIELTQLLRSILSNLFISHATGVWLDLKAADYSKTRKAAQKAQGVVTVSRTASGEAITIPKGQVFKTIKDINGDELRFFALEDTVLQKDALSVEVPVEAEVEGTDYNVPVGQITRSLTYISGIDTIANGEGWVTREGITRCPSGLPGWCSGLVLSSSRSALYWLPMPFTRTSQRQQPTLPPL